MGTVCGSNYDPGAVKQTDVCLCRAMVWSHNNNGLDKHIRARHVRLKGEQAFPCTDVQK